VVIERIAPVREVLIAGGIGERRVTEPVVRWGVGIG
jgi:hypothetical protein